jgi:hypothetical protein
MSYNVIPNDDFVKVLTSIIAKRIHIQSEETFLFNLSSELMEMVLRSPMIDLEKNRDLRGFLHRFVKAREKRFNEKISLKRLRGFENLVDQMYKMDATMKKYKEHFKSVNNTSSVPLKVLKDVKEQFYVELHYVRDLENWQFHVDTDLLIMKPNGIVPADFHQIDPVKSVENDLDKLGFVQKKLTSKSKLYEKVDEEATAAVTDKKDHNQQDEATKNTSIGRAPKPLPLDFRTDMQKFSAHSIMGDPMNPLTPKVTHSGRNLLLGHASPKTPGTPDGHFSPKPVSRKARIVMSKTQ